MKMFGRNMPLLILGTLYLSQEIISQPQWLWIFGPCILRTNEPCLGDEVTYTYYNSYDRHVGRRLDVNSPNAGPGFDPLLPTKVVIYGYGDRDPDSNVQKIRKAYLQHGDYNVIVVEWWELSRPVCLLHAAYNTPHVGKCLAKLLIGLGKTYPGFEPWRIHVIGFSLGAHIAGHASGFIHNATENRFERITGLDPATPLVTGFGRRRVLDVNDADFVDVIHTNAGISGAINTVGDVDFYVNGGTFQTNCTKNITNTPDTECSHIRAPTLYAESVVSVVGFWGTKCDTLYHAVKGQCPGFDTQPRVIMGDRCPTNARGLFHVNTAVSPPYALGHE